MRLGEYELLRELPDLTFSRCFVARKGESFFFLKSSSQRGDHFLKELDFQKKALQLEGSIKPIEILKPTMSTAETIVYPLLTSSFLNEFANSKLTDRIRLIACLSTNILELHSAGYLHGDLKIENIVLREGRPLLIDFGTVRRLDSSEHRELGAISNHQPPDQVWTSAVDIYALGVLLYQALYGWNFVADFVFTGFSFTKPIFELPASARTKIETLIRESTCPRVNDRMKLALFIQRIGSLLESLEDCAN